MLKEGKPRRVADRTADSSRPLRRVRGGCLTVGRSGPAEQRSAGPNVDDRDGSRRLRTRSCLWSEPCDERTDMGNRDRQARQGTEMTTIDDGAKRAQEFEAQGFTVARGFFSKDEAARMLADVQHCVGDDTRSVQAM